MSRLAQFLVVSPFIMAAASLVALAQEPVTTQPERDTEISHGASRQEIPTTNPDAKPYSQPPFFRLDYSGDFWHAPAMTGDWGGARTKLAEHGLSLNVNVLQYGMSNAYGGRSTNGGMAYSGTVTELLQI